MKARQLYDGINRYFDVNRRAEAVYRLPVMFNRSGNRAEAAIVTVRQFLSVDKGGLSVNSDSSSQSCAESLACSPPYNFVTAETKEDSSCSAR
jgi:hypothetical protein